MRLFGRGLVVAGAITVALGIASGPASAAASSTSPVVVTISVPSGTLTVTFNSGSQSTLQMALNNAMQGATSSAASITPERVSPPGGGNYVNVHCNVSYAWSDSDGTFTYQHSCSGTTSPWGYKLSAGVQAITVSEVDEYGMEWQRNGVDMSQQSPHLVAKSYQFHNTFNPLHNGDYLYYLDQFTFTVEVDGHTGSADLMIDGNLHQLSTS